MREFELSGPMLSATAQGSIAASRRPEDGALDLEVDLVVVDPALRDRWSSPTAFDSTRTAPRRLRVTGTVSRPVLD